MTLDKSQDTTMRFFSKEMRGLGKIKLEGFKIKLHDYLLHIKTVFLIPHVAEITVAVVDYRMPTMFSVFHCLIYSNNF